jgi:hypothetical protein
MKMVRDEGAIGWDPEVHRGRNGAAGENRVRKLGETAPTRRGSTFEVIWARPRAASLRCLCTPRPTASFSARAFQALSHQKKV